MPNWRCMLRAIFRQDFRDKYLYVLTTIPEADLPKPFTIFNHVLYELDKCPAHKQKLEKTRESRPGSRRHTTEWLWNRGDITLELHQQKINRQEFDRTLKGKTQVLGPNMQLRKGADASAAPAPADPTVAATPATREKKKKKKKKEVSDVPATPAPKGKGKGESGASYSAPLAALRPPQ